jgi:pimeloyl-ACP methyl ester carboxylesterase
MKKISHTLKKMLLIIIAAASFQNCTSPTQKNDTVIKEPADKRILPNATNSRNEFAEINGKKIAYRSIGEGEPFILCQRFRGNMDDWDPAFLDALSKNYNVIIFDYTGFGLSTGPLPTTALAFAEDVRDLAKALNFKKIIVGGWSLGGWVAQIVTTQFSDIVAQTILLGTKPPGKNKYQIGQIFVETAYKPSYTLDDETILFFEPASPASRDSSKKSHERIAKRTTDQDIKIKEVLWPYYQKCGDDFVADPYKARQKIITMKTPMLVISADHEICFPPENWFALNQQLNATQVIVIPQSGHGVQHQYPNLVAKYITAFIEEHR